MCTRTGGALAHVLEANGLVTLQLSSDRGVTKRIGPPRALYCEFPLGRPLGRQDDAAFQRRVLDAAFALLGRNSGPVLEDFPETIDDEGVEPLLCPVPPRLRSPAGEEIDEALSLRSAYDRQRARTGRTVLGKLVGPDEVPDAIAAFVRVVESGSWGEVNARGPGRLLAQDIRAYYEEAALELADRIPEAHATESWFYQKTATGKAIRKAQRIMREGGAAEGDWVFLVPRSLQ